MRFIRNNQRTKNKSNKPGISQHRSGNQSTEPTCVKKKKCFVAVYTPPLTTDKFSPLSLHKNVEEEEEQLNANISQACFIN